MGQQLATPTGAWETTERLLAFGGPSQRDARKLEPIRDPHVILLGHRATV
jgi:hypothetical protein